MREGEGRFQVRASTVVLSLSLSAGALGFGLGFLADRDVLSVSDTVVTVLLLGIFPTLVGFSAVLSLVYLIIFRRWQFAVEFGVAAALLFWLSRWEYL